MEATVRKPIGAFRATGKVASDLMQGKRQLLVSVFWNVALLFSMYLAACGGSKSSSGPPPPPVVAASTYVDCSAATNGSGSQSSPWNTLASVSAATFSPGDKLFFKRGMTCSGILEPLGSGTTASPIVIDAYGIGPQPIIDGGMNTAAVQLIN